MHLTCFQPQREFFYFLTFSQAGVWRRSDRRTLALCQRPSAATISVKPLSNIFGGFFFSFCQIKIFPALNYGRVAADKYTAVPETRSPDERALGAVSLVWQPR